MSCVTRRITLSAIAAGMVLWAHASPAQFGESMSSKVDGETRRAMVYPPTEDRGGRAPLVLAFHGHGDTIQNFERSGMHFAFPEAVVVYFQGLKSSRDGGTGWQVDTGGDDDRDLKLVDAALASLRKTFRVDDSRIYAMGFSNGAGLTYLLWVERPSVFAAFAPVSGRLQASSEPQQPKPLFHIAGALEPSLVAQEESFEIATGINGVEDQSSCAGADAPCSAKRARPRRCCGFIRAATSIPRMRRTGSRSSSAGTDSGEAREGLPPATRHLSP